MRDTCGEGRIARASSPCHTAPLWTQLRVPPGQTVILMHFVAETWDIDEARQKTDRLGKLTDPDALTGLTAQEKAQIVNFAVAQ